MPKPQSSSAASDASKLTGDAIDTVNEFVHGVTEFERAWLDAGFARWSMEFQRYYEELNAQATKTFAQLRTCQTPLDVLKVEQEWWTARSKAYLESGLRLAQLFSDATMRMDSYPLPE